MHIISGISTSIAFEKPSSTQESRTTVSETESSPFLKLLEEAINSPPVEAEEQASSPHEKEEVFENPPEQEDSLLELEKDQEQNLEPVIMTFLPVNWEVAETIENEISPLENTEKLETEVLLEIPNLNSEEIPELSEIESEIKNDFPELEEKNLEPKVNFGNTNFSESKVNENLAHNLIPFQETQEERPSVSISQFSVEKNISFEEIKNISSNLNSNLEIPFQDTKEEFLATQKEGFPSKIKSENSKTFYSQNLESNEKNPEIKEQKLSSELLSILKDKLSFAKEEKLEKVFEQDQANKQSISPNVKTFVPKEELPQVSEVKFTQTSEKENQTVLLTVQNVKSSSPKDVNNKSAVYESSKSASQIFQNNTPEIVKTAKFQILENGKNFAIIELEPKELGKVLLQISMENEKIHGKLFFETEAAKLVFQSELQNLKNELRIAGLEIDSLFVDLNDPEQNPKEFFAFEDSSYPQATQESSSQTELESSEEISQTTKRLLDVRV